VNKESIVCCNESTVDYTFINTLGHRSLIDHFLTSANLNPLAERVSVCHVGDNPSDHEPLSISINLAVEYLQSNNRKFKSKPKW